MNKTGPVSAIVIAVVSIINIVKQGDWLVNGRVNDATILALVACGFVVLYNIADIYAGWASLTKKEDDDHRAGIFRNFLGILSGKKPEKLSEKKTDTVQ